VPGTWPAPNRPPEPCPEKSQTGRARGRVHGRRTRRSRERTRLAPGPDPARSERGPDLDGLVPGAQRRRAPRLPAAPALVRPASPPAAAARHLAARTRRRGAAKRLDLGRPAGRRRLRRGQPRRSGTAPSALLVGRSGPDLGSRPPAGDPAPRAAVARDRSLADLRLRRQHGRAGGAPARRPPSAPARGRGGLRRTDEPRAPLPRIRSLAARQASAAADPCRGRRDAVGRSTRVRDPQPARPGAEPCPKRRSAADLVEPP
jgi:hypothetical protein